MLYHTNLQNNPFLLIQNVSMRVFTRWYDSSHVHTLAYAPVGIWNWKILQENVFNTFTPALFLCRNPESNLHPLISDLLNFQSFLSQSTLLRFLLFLQLQSQFLSFSLSIPPWFIPVSLQGSVCNVDSPDAYFPGVPWWVPPPTQQLWPLSM